MHQGLAQFDAIVNWDHLYVGGGNARLLDQRDIGANATLVSNSNGLLGGLRIWDLHD
ncbi:unannotated protein [freshwater metagenome]|uniref:Unannotated protein n=1 Tax=freshwater metagenome TaxID=449393 RepID=A0A6J7GEV2_9ZZZZ|nr:hypothetical protein [Actinomycetota bacterium]